MEVEDLPVPPFCEATEMIIRYVLAEKAKMGFSRPISLSSYWQVKSVVSTRKFKSINHLYLIGGVNTVEKTPVALCSKL